MFPPPPNGFYPGWPGPPQPLPPMRPGQPMPQFVPGVPGPFPGPPPGDWVPHHFPPPPPNWRPPPGMHMGPPPPPTLSRQPSTSEATGSSGRASRRTSRSSNGSANGTVRVNGTRSNGTTTGTTSPGEGVSSSDFENGRSVHQGLVGPSLVAQLVSRSCVMYIFLYPAPSPLRPVALLLVHAIHTVYQYRTVLRIMVSQGSRVAGDHDHQLTSFDRPEIRRSLCDMPLSLPIISIEPYVRRSDVNEADRLATSAALHTACVEYGCVGVDA